MFYIAERNFNDKAARYSDTVFELKKIGLWYESLSEVERNVERNFIKLVKDTEMTIAKEIKARFNKNESQLDKNTNQDKKGKRN